MLNRGEIIRIAVFNFGQTHQITCATPMRKERDGCANSHQSLEDGYTHKASVRTATNYIFVLLATLPFCSSKQSQCLPTVAYCILSKQ